MSQKVVGINVESRIVIGHGTTEVVLVVAGHRTVNIVDGMFRQQVNALAQEFLPFLPFLTCETDHGPFCPDAAIIGIQFQTLVQRLHRFGCVFLQQIDLSLHGIGTGILRPSGSHRVDLCQGTIVLFLLYQTKDTVMP